jgi:MFS family permease
VCCDRLSAFKTETKLAIISFLRTIYGQEVCPVWYIAKVRQDPQNPRPANPDDWSYQTEDIDGGSPSSFDRVETGTAYDDTLVCPPHTTERKLVNKIDFHVVPFLCILYLLAFLDRWVATSRKREQRNYNLTTNLYRVNIANANVAGMSVELGLEGHEYNNALVIFFAPYIFFEIPSNILLKKFKPHVWLSACMFLFGLTTTLQGVVTNYSGLLATRFFLGVFESGMFPGCFYLLSSWYLRTEAQRRYSFFFSSTTLAGAFAGLLAAAIGKMDGVAGYQGWRWVSVTRGFTYTRMVADKIWQIFILEGILTCAVSAAFFFVIPDFPEDVKWLSEEERTYVVNRLRSEQGASAVERKMGVKDVGNVFKDYKIFLGGFMYFGLIVPAYS